ncbi:dihydropteroate synthase [Solicola gregarius]|uniref:Dihydropteroate synthase n=2 Tax=Solicola gregarius TaxID=2908642 RepID=A0AA46YNU4_9ACTN|nr:dihydropteroate synthase [Solicola gregarius]UYM07841.1 dihydropteroate synthase [Solicola gregarius]
MGVVNVTPDSFSDGGRWFDTDRAIDHALELVAEGADIVDVGGESTRPGANRVEPEEELRRVIPVVRALADRGTVVSVDTMRSRVAAEALDAGARIVNDVSGGRAEPRVLEVAAEAGAPFVLMHWRQHSAVMQGREHTAYDDVVRDVIAEMRPAIDSALQAGVRPDRLIVDPGLGFSKTGEQNWTILAGLAAFAELGYPVLVAASRKRFLGELLAAPDGTPAPTDNRDAASAAITTLAAAAGAWCVRVHDVRPSADAVRVVARWSRG